MNLRNVSPWSDADPDGPPGGPVLTGSVLPPIRTEHRWPAPGGRWAYDAWGRHGRPVLLIPAVMFDRRMWWPVAADLRPHGTVVAVDLPGHGASARRARYDPEEIVDDLARLVAGLGVTRAPVVVGHGASAAFAVLFAARYATHAVVTVDAPPDGHRAARVDEYLAGMDLDALPDRYRDLARPAGDAGLLTGYADCLEVPPAGRTVRLAVHSRPPSQPVEDRRVAVYDVPSRFAHLTAGSRFVRDICALL
jgi:pimeloyl-ACP methyl ester carboxylesterase